MLIPSIDLLGGRIVQLVQGEKLRLAFDDFEYWIEKFSRFPLVQLIDLDAAMRGYKELNLRALRMLSPGGTLVSCSCSHHVSIEDFLAVLRSAAADANRRVQLLELRGAAPDHPAILTLLETAYLKCLILRVQ